MAILCLLIVIYLLREIVGVYIKKIKYYTLGSNYEVNLIYLLGK